MNPPIPEWNSLSNDEREHLSRFWRESVCSCCQYAQGGSYFYDEIRKILIAREQRYNAATMAGPPAEHWT